MEEFARILVELPLDFCGEFVEYGPAFCQLQWQVVPVDRCEVSVSCAVSFEVAKAALFCALFQEFVDIAAIFVALFGSSVPGVFAFFGLSVFFEV